MKKPEIGDVYEVALNELLALWEIYIITTRIYDKQIPVISWIAGKINEEIQSFISASIKELLEVECQKEVLDRINEILK